MRAFWFSEDIRLSVKAASPNHSSTIPPVLKIVLRKNGNYVFIPLSSSPVSSYDDVINNVVSSAPVPLTTVGNSQIEDRIDPFTVYPSGYWS